MIIYFSSVLEDIEKLNMELFLMYIKRVLPIIFLLLCLSIPVRCEELITGRVVSVNRDKGEVVVDIFHDGSGEGAKDPVRQVTIVVDDGIIPWGVREGRMVRVWLNSLEDSGTISATRIRPGCGCDRTGVRGRLRKAGGLGGLGGMTGGGTGRGLHGGHGGGRGRGGGGH